MTVYASPGQPRRVNFGWIDESFQIVKRDWGLWALAVLIQMFFGIIVNLAVFGVFIALGHNPYGGMTFTSTPASPTDIYTPTYWLFVAITAIINIPMTAFLYGGYFKMANKAVRGQVIDIGDLFSGGSTVLTFALFDLLLIVLCDIAFPCGLLFGGFVVLGLLFPTFALLADGESLSTALNRSIEGMKRDWLSAAGLAFVFSLLYIVTGCCCAPLFITVPMSFVIGALAYRDMIYSGPTQGQFFQQDAGVWPPPPDFSGGAGFTPPPVPPAPSTPPEPRVEPWSPPAPEDPQKDDNPE